MLFPSGIWLHGLRWLWFWSKVCVFFKASARDLKIMAKWKTLISDESIFFFFSKHIFFFTFTTYWIWNASKNERLKPHLIFFSERCFLLVDFYLVRRTHFVTRVQSMVWVFFEAVRFKNKAQSEVWQIERLNKATNPFFFFSKLLLLCMMVVWPVAVDMIYNHIPASTQINDSYCLMPHVHSLNSQFEIYKNRKT